MASKLENLHKKFEDLITKPPTTMREFEDFLIRWWCRQYNQPYKSTGWMDYTFEELLFEYLDISYRNNPEIFNEIRKETQKKDQLEDDDEWMEMAAAAEGMSFVDDETAKKISQEAYKRIHSFEDKGGDRPIQAKSISFEDKLIQEFEEDFSKETK